MTWFYPWLSSTGPDSGDVVQITPKKAGWMHCGLLVTRLEPGVMRTVSTGESEVFVLPLSGGLTIEVADAATPAVTETRLGLTGRASVFDRVTDFAYVGRGSLLRMISAHGAEVALPSAVCERRLPARYGPADRVPVEVRGAGPATRQVTNFGVPGVWEHAEKLVCCEVITPAGNWSSYPPHKHDSTEPCEVANEEIYFFRIAGPDGLTPSREGFGIHSTYTGPEHSDAGLEPIEETIQVRDGDVYCIPHGYHGPSIAAPGYPMYYLNVMAGPGPERAMEFCDDAAHAWVRDTFRHQELDPRCPVTTADGRTDGRTAVTGTVGEPSPDD